MNTITIILFEMVKNIHIQVYSYKLIYTKTYYFSHRRLLTMIIIIIVIIQQL